MRDELIARGQAVERPQPPAAVAPENVTAWQARVDAMVARLLDQLPLDASERDTEQNARWALAHILDWHRREKKAAYWEFFRLRDVPEDDLLDERAGLVGLNFVGTAGGTARAPIHRYQFPAQEAELREDQRLFLPGGDPLGSLAEWDPEARTVDIKKTGNTALLHPTALFAHTVLPTDAQAESLMRIAEFVAARGWHDGVRARLARDLLLRRPPDVGSEPLRLPGETPAESAIRIAPHLAGVLPIQGPPGAGKTHVAARMIVALIKARKTVGITANSHKVILNLVEEAIKAAEEEGLDISCMHKLREKRPAEPHLSFEQDDAVMFGAIGRGVHIISGTSWLWSPQDAAATVDVLFVDEAAQMSLANVLAVSQAARGMVLLGDPRQLEQPTQGSHPEGTDVSALDYVLDGRQTIAETQGLFLDRTRGDILRLARAAVHFRPDVLNTPLDAQGLPSMRLLDVAASLGFKAERGHEAIADVEATAFVCQAIARGAPEIWSRFLQFTQKSAAFDFMRNEDAFVLFHPTGEGRGCYVVSAFGRHPTNGNLHYCLDLSCDLDALRRLSSEELSRVLSDSKLIWRVKANAGPVLFPIYEGLEKAFKPLTEEEASRKAASLRADGELVELLTAAAVAGETTYPPSTNVEDQLYSSGFFEPGDRSLMHQFHSSDWVDRPSYLAQMRDMRLRRLGQRIIYFERPDLLDSCVVTTLEAAIRGRRFAKDDVSWRTLSIARKELQEVDDPTALGLAGFSNYLDGLAVVRNE